jgi:hypothetical protein
MSIFLNPAWVFYIALRAERTLVMEILILAVIMLVVTLATAVLSIFFNP